MRFFVRSLLVLLLLYGLVFAVGTAYFARAGFPLWTPVVFTFLIVGLQYLLAPWFIERLLDIFWDDLGTQLPARNREFLEHLCAQRGLKMPRIGIIESGTPNAFAFGRTPSDARVVVTSGLLDVLTPEEANAVLAHELGHIEHWDFLVMTVAALVPLLLYQLYIWSDRVNNFRVVAYTAYLCYLFSQFVILLLNRTREYFADHYSAEVTHAPNDLSSALIKIAYGMVRAEGEYKRRLSEVSRGERAELQKDYRKAGSLALMGISNLRSGTSLALASANPADAASVMRWDLVNPWARVYELNSTHPLTALRVRELNRSAEEMHQQTQYPVPKESAIAWGSFPLEVVLWAAPVIAAAMLVLSFWWPDFLQYLRLGLSDSARPSLMVFAGITWILRTWFRYRGEFRPSDVGTLIRDVEVSQMRPRAVQLRGEIVGRGVPGAFWSPDLVLRDETGIIFVLYRQSIPFARFLFSITAAQDYIGQKVVIEGWFRRGLSPYVEMSRLTGHDGTVHRAYSRWVQYAVAGIATVMGCLWLLA